MADEQTKQMIDIINKYKKESCLNCVYTCIHNVIDKVCWNCYYLSHLSDMVIKINFLEMLYLVAQTILSYFIILMFDKKGSLYVVVISYLILFYFHIYRLIYAYGQYNIELSGLLMITTIKF
jgi:hypothetical protein